MSRKGQLVMVFVAVGVFGACGGDDAPAEGQPTAESESRDTATNGESEAAAIERYCDAVAVTDKRGEELFRDVEEGNEAALEKAERAMLEHVRTTFPRGEELPDAIEDDFEGFLAGFERRVEGGLEPTKQQQAAEKRLLD